MIEAAWSIAIAKPIPSALPAEAVLMPITRPLASSSGPPLLPSLMAASVWRRLLIVRRWRVEGSPTVIERRVAGGHPAGEIAAVLERDREGPAAFDDVVVGEDQAARVVNES